MAYNSEAMRTPGAEEQEQSAKAKRPETETAVEYFARYEKSPGSERDMQENKLDYWLSEEEEENQQLKRHKGRSQLKKLPYVVQDAKAPKLRPAEDILSRLRWDASLDIANFTIGYLERFEGIKEMPVSTWVRETTDEDFIPQHRIKYFKRNSDGEIVWDREGRIDKFFGSGLTGREDVILETEKDKTELPNNPPGD